MQNMSGKAQEKMSVLGLHQELLILIISAGGWAGAKIQEIKGNKVEVLGHGVYSMILKASSNLVILGILGIIRFVQWIDFIPLRTFS